MRIDKNLLTLIHVFVLLFVVYGIVAQNVGINTSGPDRRLDVLDGTNPQLRLTFTDGTVYTDFLTTSGGHLYLNPSGGNVGIGINPPTSPFHVVAAGVKTGAFTSVLFSNTATNATANANKIGLNVSSTGVWTGAGAGNNYGLYVSSVTGGTNNYDAIFNGGGNVGIGNAAPISRLDLSGATAGDITMGLSTMAGAFAGVKMNSADGADASWLGLSGGGALNLSTRGAYIDLFGNEIAFLGLGGDVIIGAGQATSGNGAIYFNTDPGAGSITRMTILNGGNVGIGGGIPGSLFHCHTSTTATGLTIFEQASADADSYDINFRKARGTVAVPTVITTVDELGTIAFRGYSGAAGYVTGAAIKSISEGTIATTRVPAHLSFWTGTDAAPTVLTERMRIDAGGNVGVGFTSSNTSPTPFKFAVNGDLGIGSFCTGSSEGNNLHIWPSDVGGANGYGFGGANPANVVIEENDAEQSIAFLGTATAIQLIVFGRAGNSGAGKIQFDHNTNRYGITGGNVGIGTTSPTSALQVVGLPVYANNAAAIAGGLTVGAFYRTGGDPALVCVVY